MQIKFQIVYGYMPHWKNNFQAIVSAWLPKEPNENVVAYCYQCEFNGVKVSCYSGEENGEWRVIKIHFDAETIEKLNEKIFQEIDEYKKKVAINIYLIEKMKENKKELLLEFPNPVKVWE